MTFDAGQCFDPGDYERLFNVTVDGRTACGPLNEFTLADGLTSIIVTVDVYVDFFIADANTSFGGGDAAKNYDINIGALTSGETSTVYLQLRGNTPTDVEFSSLNSGSLVHETQGFAASVPYTFQVNRVSQPIDSGTGSCISISKTGRTGQPTTNCASNSAQ
jgi:hypothetical protein